MSKPKAKKKDSLTTALEWEKKSLATYTKMEAEATKKQNRTLMSTFSGLRKDAEKHVKNIQKTMDKIKQEEAKLKERQRREREKAKAQQARAKAAKKK